MFAKYIFVGLVLSTATVTATQAALVHQYKASDYVGGSGTAVWNDNVGTNDLTNAGSSAVSVRLSHLPIGVWAR